MVSVCFFGGRQMPKQVVQGRAQFCVNEEKAFKLQREVAGRPRVKRQLVFVTDVRSDCDIPTRSVRNVGG